MELGNMIIKTETYIEKREKNLVDIAVAKHERKNALFLKDDYLKHIKSMHSVISDYDDFITDYDNIVSELNESIIEIKKSNSSLGYKLVE